MVKCTVLRATLIVGCVQTGVCCCAGSEVDNGGSDQTSRGASQGGLDLDARALCGIHVLKYLVQAQRFAGRSSTAGPGNAVFTNKNVHRACRFKC